MTDLPEPDALPGAPHPRDTLRVFGHEAAQDTFLRAASSDRLHHGWLITGPKGIGKATLAWHMARFLLATAPPDPNALFPASPPASLEIASEHPVARRLRALSEPNFYLLRRGATERGDRLATEIRVDDVRKLKGFFALSASDGGRRVVMIDAADELNANAANAILKLLEEPPASTILLLVCHQPARLLPTIRSRCRMLRLDVLSADALSNALAQAGMAFDPAQAASLSELANGSVGRALQMAQQEGLAVYQHLTQLFAPWPDLDRAGLSKLAESATGKAASERRDLILDLVETFTARIARTGALRTAPSVQLAPGEARLLSRLAPDLRASRAWADAAAAALARARHARAVNMDPSQIILDVVLSLKRAF